ncbi:MAG: S-methyl-5'-thioadenosine phosphorylase [Pseudomonadota bacterium]
MSETILGVIGGSGVYRLPELEDVTERVVETPFGAASSPMLSGVIAGQEVHFLARHGVGHRLNPSEVPYRANLWALKDAGVTAVLSVSAVGSLVAEVAPGHLVVPDQIIDRTLGCRGSTYLEKGVVGHVTFGDPYCKDLRDIVETSTAATGATLHRGGTLVCIEGPAFSTRAESNLYRSWGGTLVGMTAIPEAKLAREAALCYTTLALCTDYDCWHETEDDVSVDAVIEVMKRNTISARAVVVDLCRRLSGAGAPRCGCARALDAALITPRDEIPAEVRERLGPILRRP